MLMKGISLKGLEVFEALAVSGSVAGASEATGLSQPAVSQQMRNLETALGVALVDHGRRPMQLTQVGRSFLARARVSLAQLRLAQNELTVMDLTHVEELKLGVIDDFDNDLTPRLVALLAQNMARSRFKLVTAPSHEIGAAVSARKLDLAIAGATGEPFESISEYPLLTDPYIFVCQKGKAAELGSLEAVMHALPLLRYDRAQLIGRQVEAHLAQQGLNFPHRFEIGAHLSLMTLAARGIGWALTTPTGYMRAARQHDHLEAHPVPFTPFARRISLFASSDWGDTVPGDVARTVRGLLADMVLNPALEALPWLADQMTLCE
ncbi:LysR family transcriptional regulator [Tropicibacter naphthalenivorans]|uniref:Morphology and auto-aggregation control protein n=1 Tax=Tropicibacter naphthalenivorans TaxID=441103 RepID=A0A0P1GKB7_9RHOB|nr:LysR family transcriptional regulator [Tropicibacter naphthalenivorans]CUH82445.1 Morphology and auto-aggregation control protein [Tropicibacter naphthalenivorans]SMD06086.1 transcriptional regulator, LysR family [Tropicibacter naphthalenivorans]